MKQALKKELALTKLETGQELASSCPEMQYSSNQHHLAELLVTKPLLIVAMRQEHTAQGSIFWFRR